MVLYIIYLCFIVGDTAVSVEMEKVTGRESRCAVLHFNSEREAREFLPDDLYGQQSDQG